MKTTFLTRNLFIGALIGLVLAFSVPGIADALTFGTSRSGDLVTVSPDQPFTIRFSVSLNSPVAENPRTARASTTDIEYAAGTRTRETTPDPLTRNYTETVDAGYDAGDTHYYTGTTTSENHGGTTFTLTTNTRNWLTESEAYDYNDEAVTISSLPPLQLRKGNAVVTSLTETHKDSDHRLSSSITLTGSHAFAGAYDIEIMDATPDTDYPDDTAPSPRASIKFTVFVVGSGDGSTHIDEWGFKGLESGGYQSDIYDDLPITDAVEDSHIRVEYEILEGSGRLYVKKGTRRTSAARMISTSSAAEVWLDVSNSTNKVRAVIAGAYAQTGLFIYGAPNVAITGGNSQTGIISQRLEDALVVRVRDGKNRAISGLPVDFDTDASQAMFIPVPGTTVYVDEDETLVDEIDTDTVTKSATSTSPSPAADIIVQTDSRGEAKTYFQLGGTIGTQNVTVWAGGYPPFDPGRFSFDARASTGRGPILSILSGNNQRTDEDGDLDNPLVVVVRQGKVGEIKALKPGEIVRFYTFKGTLIGYELANDGTVNTAKKLRGKRVYVETDANGQAQVLYYQFQNSGSDTVTARIEGTTPVFYQDEVTFNINGSGGGDSGDGDPDPQATTTRGSLNISASGSGTTRDITVDALRAGITQSGINVILTVNNGATLSHKSGATPLRSTLTLPATAGNYLLTAKTTADYAGDSETIAVTLPGTLSLEEIGARATNGGQSVRVTVREADDSLASGSVNVVLSGAVNRTIRTTAGTGTAVIALPTTGGPYTVTLRATGYNDGFHTFSATRQTTPGTPTGPAGVADSIEIDGDRRLSGTVNQALRLRARVLDANDRGVSGVRVTFKILRPGGEGRLSQRGNGLATQVETDRNGYANATLTPLGGDLIVEAKAARVKAPVSFIIDVNGVSDAGTDTSSREPTETPSREISPEVLLGAAQRPPMVWVDSSGIYALVGASVGRFTTGSGVVMDIAVGGNKIYWTAQTGKNTGTINSANLDGTGAKQLVSIRAVPRGIAVDPVAKRLYWTNSQGWIQSSNLEGRARRNVISGGLEDPMGIAVSGGNMYWTQSLEGAPIERVNLMEGDVNRPAFWKGATPGTPEGLAIFGGKIYWTEKTGENSGTINRVNLNGEHPKQLVSIRAVPRGIAVDPVAERLYWTNSRGWVQSSDLKGRARRNVANGLGSPGGIVVNANIKAPAATPTKTDISTTASTSKYDINGDGTVDSTDVDALLLAVLAELTNAKYDVNGDGAVDVKDVREVNKNRGAGAAGAPALLGMKFSALEVDRLQEQIDLLIATNDRSPAAMRTLTYLQQLIVMARPDQTQLLANYPNPFNPETWIPYELATDTDVRITIYNAQGVVIRTLQLGQQSAGYYTDRERAAYWDGRNAFGERVASGIYFYQLETDTMSALRKMVILK